MVGSSQVVAAAQTKVGLDIVAYPNQTAATQAAENGALYGAYVTGKSSDTLIVVPSRSFFAWTEIEPVFLGAAHKLNRPVTVQTVKPLPASDNIRAVVSILLIPLLVGSYLCTLAVFIFTKTARTRWRWLILPGFAVVGAVLTDVIAGPPVRFEQAAKSTGQKLKVQEHAPVAPAAKDPFVLVPTWAGRLLRAP